MGDARYLPYMISKWFFMIILQSPVTCHLMRLVEQYSRKNFLITGVSVPKIQIFFCHSNLPIVVVWLPPLGTNVT